MSHDRYFTSKLATRILALSPDGSMDFRGTYEEYREDCARRAGGETVSVQAEKPSSGKEEYLARKQEAARLRQRQKRRQTIGADIEKLEKRLVEIQDELFGDAASDYKRAAALEDERITTEDLLMQLYEEEEDLAKGD